MICENVDNWLTDVDLFETWCNFLFLCIKVLFRRYGMEKRFQRRYISLVLLIFIPPIMLKNIDPTAISFPFYLGFILLCSYSSVFLLWSPSYLTICLITVNGERGSFYSFRSYWCKVSYTSLGQKKFLLNKCTTASMSMLYLNQSQSDWYVGV